MKELMKKYNFIEINSDDELDKYLKIGKYKKEKKMKKLWNKIKNLVF